MSAGRQRFSIIPAMAVTDQRIEPRDLQVLCLLGRHIDDLGWCTRSQVKMARELNCGRATVQRALTRLVEAGYVEHRAKQRASGADAAHDYRVVIDPPQPETARETAPEGVPTDGQGVPIDGQGVPTHGRAPMLTSPVKPEREGAGARDEETAPAQAAPADTADTPGTAAFEKRVMRFCNGRGFLAGPWQDWDTSSPNWIGRQFARLDPAERAEAERWRDAYLLDLQARGKSPGKVGIFLRDRLWTGLDPSLLERLEKRRNATLAPEERQQPDGWAACLGNAGRAWLVAKLLAGPASPELAARPFLNDARLRDAWPAVWWWQASHRQKGGALFDPVWHERKHLMEFVPHRTAMAAAWRDAFAVRGWRWLAVFDGGNGLWLPKGGPDGLEAFEAAIRNEANGDDGGGREAAE